MAYQIEKRKLDDEEDAFNAMNRLQAIEEANKKMHDN